MPTDKLSKREQERKLAELEQSFLLMVGSTLRGILSRYRHRLSDFADLTLLQDGGRCDIEYRDQLAHRVATLSIQLDGNGKVVFHSSIVGPTPDDVLLDAVTPTILDEALKAFLLAAIKK